MSSVCVNFVKSLFIALLDLTLLPFKYMEICEFISLLNFQTSCCCCADLYVKAACLATTFYAFFCVFFFFVCAFSFIILLRRQGRALAIAAWNFKLLGNLNELKHAQSMAGRQLLFIIICWPLLFIYLCIYY